MGIKEKEKALSQKGGTHCREIDIRQDLCCVARICVEVWFRLRLCLVAKLTSVKVVIALAANNASDSHSGPRERNWALSSSFESLVLVPGAYRAKGLPCVPECFLSRRVSSTVQASGFPLAMT